MAEPSTKRLWLAVPLVALVALLGGLGWYWQDTLRCQQIEIAGAQHAGEAALIDLAGVDTSMTLFEIDPTLVADRVRRHPWVRDARVTRLPTGTLAIHVEERTPAALVLDRSGDASHYLDPGGFGMPVRDEAGTLIAYNVPVLRGVRAPYHPVQPAEAPALRALLAALHTTDAATRALISEAEIDRAGSVTLHTTPTGDFGSLPVKIGTAPFAERLAKLHAFWHQAVLTQPGKRFALIDLRFEGQVVTQETTDS